MIEPVAIDHVCLSVRSLEQAAAYYARVLGARCFARDDAPGTLAMEAERVRFFLAEAGANADPAALAAQHLAFRVASLDSVIAALDELGIRARSTGRVDCFTRDNYRWCEWRDPDGIRLECVEVGN